MSTGQEAPASSTLKMVYKGVEVLITQRDLEVKMMPYLTQAKTVIEWGLANGFEPVPARTFSKKPEQPKVYADHTCPTCNAKVLKKTTKDGKAFEECENRKYDFKSKTTSGCSYIKWPESQP